MKNIFGLFLFLSIISCQPKKEKKKIIQNQRPNIVYILADDMGYGDLSSLNPKSGISTPHMDKIVQQGISFTDAHSNSAVCTPTRYGILTGRYAWKSRLKKGVLWGYGKPLIESDRMTVASFLKDNGYTTACIGKWHLGLGWQPKNLNEPIKQLEWSEVLTKGEDNNVDYTKTASGPKDLGFDYSYIIPASLDMAPYVYLENDRPTALPTGYTEGKNQDEHGRGVIWRAGEMDENFDFDNVLPHFTKKATRFINQQAAGDKPFFLYFPLTAPHTPWLPSEYVDGKSQAGTYGDFVTMVDNTVGEVVAALEKSNMVDNTLIIVTSDNGSHWRPDDKEKYAHRANYIYRGQKADIYEGGHHVPFIAQWPGKIEPSTTSDQVMSTTDLLATVAGLLKKQLPKSAGEDSYDMWPAYIGQTKEPIRDFVVHHSLHGYFSIRKGKWKLTPNLGSGGFSQPQFEDPAEEGFEGTLYDMQNDPQEQNNLYNQYHEVVSELSLLLEKNTTEYK